VNECNALAEIEDLKIQKTYFKELFENSPEAIVVLDLDDVIVHINSEFSKIFGYTQEEAAGYTISSPIVPEDLKDEAIQYSKTLIHGKRIDVETKRSRKDGTLFDVSILGAPIIHNGLLIGIYAIYRDISNRKVIEKSLKLYVDIFNNTQSGLHIYQLENINDDRTLRMISANLASEKLTGVPTKDIIGKMLDENFPGLRERDIPQKYAEVVHTGKPLMLEEVYYGDDRVISVVFSVKAFPLPNNCVGVSFENITERKKAEIAVYESEEKYRALVEKASDGIILQQDGFIKYINTALENIMGYSSNEMIGTPFVEYMHPDEKIILKKRSLKLLKGEYISTKYESRIRHKEGHFIFVEINASVIPFQEKPGNFAIIRDITERKNAEEKIRFALKEKEALLNEVLHRVKNNFQVISSLLTFQLDHIEDEKYKSIFMDSVKRIESMSFIHEMLYQSESFSQIDFSEYIQRLCNNLISTYAVDSDKIKIFINTQGIVLNMKTAIPVGLILNELISNALKHAFPNNINGEIRILMKESNDEMIELTVRDNGIGVPEEIDWRNTNTLGLEIISLLGEGQLRGKVTLNRNKGTEFKIIFKRK